MLDQKMGKREERERERDKQITNYKGCYNVSFPLNTLKIFTGND